jgi:diguanylate cyclase (GGDEF)-like protein
VLLDIFASQAMHIIQNSELYKELEFRNIELSKKNQELMQLFGQLSQSEQQRAQFEQLSYLDFLTGLPNRRYFESRFQEELSRSRRHKLYLACLMMDIDHFKKVNDEYGHVAGDYVLRELGNLLSQKKRPYDLVCRYGGEEFAMVFKHIDNDDAGLVAEWIRSSIEKHQFFFDGKVLKVTMSIGAVVLRPVSEEDTVESLFQKADKALYAAKEGGRNRCVFCGEVEPTE